MILADNPLQAILWDMDGVLVDNNELHYQTWVEIYRIYGHGEQPLSRARFNSIFGMRNDETITHLFGSAQAGPDFITHISEVKETLFRQRLQGKVKPLPGVQHWLAYWPTVGVRQALASSAPQANIEAILAELELHSFFEVVVSGEAGQITRSKPAPDVFLEAARQLEVAPANCLVVEDAVVGVQAAKSAGMRCVAVTTTHSPADLAAADLVVENLAELPPARLVEWWPTL